MDFVPDETKKDDVPYFEDVSGSAGWSGHSTQKSERELMTEVSLAINRLGGMVVNWTPGAFGSRRGYRLHFTLNNKPGRFDIVSLPLRAKPGTPGYKTKEEKSLKMALFNLRNQLDAAWNMQHLVPGYFVLLPMMLVSDSTTLGQAWLNQGIGIDLLPSGYNEEDVIEVEFEENK